MAYSQHYLFAHRVLPESFAAEPDALLERIQVASPGAFAELWNRARPGKASSSAGLSVCLVEEPGLKLALVTMPAPQKPPEAYFIALIFEPQPHRYLVLEKAAQGTILGQWNPRANLGPGPAPEREAFLRAVRDTVNNPEELTFVAFDPGQLNVEPGELNRYLEATAANPIKITPEKLASYHAFFLLASRPAWQRLLHRAVRASWWSFFFKRRVTDYFAWYVMMMLHRAVYRDSAIGGVKFTMATQLACGYAFPRGRACWDHYPEEASPESVGEAMARHLGRPQCSKALTQLLQIHWATIQDRMEGIVLTGCEPAEPPEV